MLICSMYATYLCEKTSSSLVHMKDKCKNRLNVNSNLQIDVSKIKLDTAHLIAKKQQHSSSSK